MNIDSEDLEQVFHGCTVTFLPKDSVDRNLRYEFVSCGGKPEAVLNLEQGAASHIVARDLEDVIQEFSLWPNGDRLYEYISSRAPIVSYKWLQACIEKNDLLDEENYFVSEDRPLLWDTRSKLSPPSKITKFANDDSEWCRPQNFLQQREVHTSLTTSDMDFTVEPLRILEYTNDGSKSVVEYDAKRHAVLGAKQDQAGNSNWHVPLLDRISDTLSQTGDIYKKPKRTIVEALKEEKESRHAMEDCKHAYQVAYIKYKSVSREYTAMLKDNNRESEKEDKENCPP